jgi:hypothetical protein
LGGLWCLRGLCRLGGLRRLGGLWCLRGLRRLGRLCRLGALCRPDG